jgi:hypothetical protein
MVEQVARASFAAWAKKRGKDYVFEDMDEEEHEWSMDHARAMIEAMQVPTEAMMRAFVLQGTKRMNFKLQWAAAMKEAMK